MHLDLFFPSEPPLLPRCIAALSLHNQCCCAQSPVPFPQQQGDVLQALLMQEPGIFLGEACSRNATAVVGVIFAAEGEACEVGV